MKPITSALGFAARLAASLITTLAALSCGSDWSTGVDSPDLRSQKVVTITVNPSSDTLLPGETQLFTAKRKDGTGKESTIKPTWSVAAGGGTITAAGLFRAGSEPGIYVNTVRATSGGLSGSATVTVVAGAAATITVSPNPDTLAVGGTRTFAATGRDAAGNAAAIAPSWDVVAGGGTITNAGVFTAGTAPGTYANTVRATSGGVSGNATVIIVPMTRTMVRLVLSPDTLTLAAGGTRQFALTATWSDGSSSTPSATFSATGGTVTTGGLYTAGSTPGSYRVIATQQGGTLADTSAVTITAPGANQLAITTQPSATAQSGVAFARQPVLQLRDASANPVGQAGVVVTAAIATGGGTLGGTLTATTNASGVATFTNLAITGTAGSRTLSFSAPGFTSVASAAIAVTVPTAAQLSITTQPSATAQSGVAFAQQPVLQLRDASANPVSQAGVVVTAAIASGGGTLGGTLTATTNASGVATFTTLAITGTAGDRTLSFTAPGLTGATSTTITVTTGSGATVLFQESFDDANLAARGWYDLPAGGITSITTAQHIPGSTASLEFDFAAGATSPSPAAGGRHLFPATEQVYLRYWVKYSANWVGSGTSTGPHEFLFVTNVDGAYIGPAYTHLTMYVEQNYQNGGIPRLEAQDGANIDETRIGVDLTNVTENRAVAGCNGDSDGTHGDCYLVGTKHYNGKAWPSAQPMFLPNPGPGYKNDWHQVEAYFKLNSIVNGIGQLDGIAQYWFDGQLVIDRRNVLLRTGAHPTMSYNQFLMFPYIGDQSPVAQQMWLDDLVVMTRRP